MKQDKFCERCGSQLVEHQTNRFNTQTGKSIMSNHCPNKKCENGCEYIGYDWMWFLDRCRNCGRVVCDY